MLSRDIRRIMKENQRYAEMLEYYDRTGKLPLRKERRSFTLREISINALKDMSTDRGTSMSQILDELIDKEAKRKHQ